MKNARFYTLFIILLALQITLSSCASMVQKGALSLAEKSFQSGDCHKTLQHLMRAEQYGATTNQQKSYISYRRGTCLEVIGQRDQAIASYEYVINSFPGSEQAYLSNARLKILKPTPQYNNNIIKNNDGFHVTSSPNKQTQMSSHVENKSEESEKKSIKQEDSPIKLTKEQNIYYTKTLEKLVYRDSLGWFFNKYDKGSTNNVSVLSKSSDGSDIMLRGYYTYNNGTSGWVEVEFVNGKFYCLRFHDSANNCRSLRNPIPKQQYTSNKFTRHTSTSSSQTRQQCEDDCRRAEYDCQSHNSTTSFIEGMSGGSSPLLSYSNCSSERSSCVSSCR